MPKATAYRLTWSAEREDYELREHDYLDVSALCEKFGIDYPEGYAHMKKS